MMMHSAVEGLCVCGRREEGEDPLKQDEEQNGP